MKFIPADKAIDVMLENMSHDEKKEYFKMLMERNYKKLDSIHRHHGFLLPIPIDGLMSDSEAKKVSEEMLNSSITNNDIVEMLFDDFTPRKISEVSSDNPDMILKALREIDNKSVKSNPVNEFLSQSMGDEALTVMKACICADIAGCENLKKDLMKVYTNIIINSYNFKASIITERKKVISEDRSKAKKGKTNKHQSAALAIARKTWEQYPTASLAGLSEEIYSYLRNKYNGVPVAGTVKIWLKESGLNPNVKPKNREFKLVIPEGV